MQIHKPVYAYRLRTWEKVVDFLDLVCDEHSGYGELHTEGDTHTHHTGTCMDIQLGFDWDFNLYTQIVIFVSNIKTHKRTLLHITPIRTTEVHTCVCLPHICKHHCFYRDESSKATSNSNATRSSKM